MKTLELEGCLSKEGLFTHTLLTQSNANFGSGAGTEICLLNGKSKAVSLEKL